MTQVGDSTPWGAADGVEEIAPGIEHVSTSSHGGIKLSPERQQTVPSAARKRNGWYEGDSEWAIPAVVFADAFAAAASAPEQAEKEAREARETLINWEPDAAEALGIAFEDEQSLVRRRATLARQHANDLVAVSAISGVSQGVPKGYVEVNATPGGDRSYIRTNSEVTCLVPEEEYAQRGEFFVVDPENNPAHIPWEKAENLARIFDIDSEIARRAMKVLAVDPTDDEAEAQIQEAYSDAYLIRDARPMTGDAIRSLQLELVDELIEGHGVEAIGKNNGDPTEAAIAEYINTGDTYTTSVILDNREKVFRIESMGDFVERLERRGEARADEDGHLRLIEDEELAALAPSPKP